MNHASSADFHMNHASSADCHMNHASSADFHMNHASSADFQATSPKIRENCPFDKNFFTKKLIGSILRSVLLLEN